MIDYRLVAHLVLQSLSDIVQPMTHSSTTMPEGILALVLVHGKPSYH